MLQKETYNKKQFIKINKQDARTVEKIWEQLAESNHLTTVDM